VDVDGTRPLRGPARWPRHVAVCALLAVAIAAVYAEVGAHTYVNLDDDVYVVRNPWIREGLNWGTVRWAFTGVHEAYWIPLTWLSLALDCQLFGLHAGAQLLENVAWHAANTVLLYAVLVTATGAVGRSAWVAALFALHPMHVESVAWVSQRKDVLSTFFWMLTTLAWIGYARRPGVGRYLVVVVPFALGLLTKPMLVTLPVTLLLLDIWPLARRDRGLAWLAAEKLPLLALSLVVSAVTIWTQHGAGAVPGLAVRSLGDRIATALVNYGLYLGKLAAPLNLAVFYPLAPGDAGLAASAGLLLALVSALVLTLGRREPALVVGWLWFLVTRLPVVGLVQVGGQQIADRYSYIPSIGVFLAVAWGAPRLWAARGGAPWVPGAAGAATVVIAALVARHQVSYWRDSVTLFERAVAVTQRNFLAHNNLGEALASAGHREEAAIHYAEAVRLHPGYAPARNNQGIVLAEAGRYAEAEQEFRTALALDPGMVIAESNLATARARLGDYQDAIAHYEHVLAREPSNAVAHEGLADSLALLGRLDEAIVHYREAVRWAPGAVSARRSLAGTLRRAGREAEAEEEERVANVTP
jgi:tetratricopeptide (TPR) repeat protein